jgi:hypothetical protein
MSEARTPTHRCFQKQNHASMAKADLNKLLILDSGVARLPGGGPPIDYGALVQAALDGVAGFAFDPTDAAVLFQDTAGATPAQYFAGQMGRSVLAPKLMSDAERAAIETWVGQS